MAAATQNRQAPRLGDLKFLGRGGVAASTKIFLGTMVAWNTSGYLVPASSADALIPAGVAQEEVDNTSGANGDLECEYGVGVFGMANDAGGGSKPIAQADTGRLAWVHDDQTVCDEREGNHIPAGRVEWFDSDEGIVYVNIGDPAMLAFLVNGLETVAAVANPDEPDLSVYKRTSILTVSGTSGWALPDGIFVGQRKSVYCDAATSTPDGTLTPTNFADGTSLDIDAVSESAELEWDGSNWNLVHLVGAGINA